MPKKYFLQFVIKRAKTVWEAEKSEFLLKELAEQKNVVKEKSRLGSIRVESLLVSFLSMWVATGLAKLKIDESRGFSYVN